MSHGLRSSTFESFHSTYCEAWQYAGEPICTGNFIPGLNSNDTAVCCTVTGCATIGDGDTGAFLPTVQVF